MPYERLTAQDTSFLHLESESQPMHVGSVGLFEAGAFFDGSGHFRLDDARRIVASRLHLVPRFRKKLMEVQLQQGRPVWVDDESFDLSYHVRLTALPRPGSEEQLKALMDRLQSQVLDRRRPLWELWFVEGIEGDRVAIIQKTHHALVDGISGVDVATVLLDLEPEPQPVEAPPWRPEPAPNPAQLLAETLVERATQPAEMLRTLRAQLRGPRRLLETAAHVGRAMSAVGTNAPKMPWNAPVSPHRRFEVARIDLDHAKAVKAAASCTLNDVVLASVTGGLRSFLQSRNEPVDGLVLRAMCPVSVRSDDERMTLGNRVSAMVVDLPVGEPDTRRRLEALREETRQVKESGQALGVEAIISLTEYAAPTLLSLGARLASVARPVNLGITNVPGPQIPLYCMGAKMVEAFPYVGIIDNQALMVGVLSYAGQLGFGITGDRDVLPDLHVLAEAVEKSFAELAEAVAS